MADTKVDADARTLSADELARTLEMAASTALQDPNSTIEPQHLRSDAPGRLALAQLGGVNGDFVAGLEIGATIGEGGMGVVRAATQRSLGRKVAVKTLRPGMKTERSTLRLLREAWVTGSLEHPNIVPVYDVGLDADASPVIVLKHIEGAPWSDLVFDEARAREQLGPGDLLEHNLRILVQVCNAVSLAHARGVLHRDLKPENVMIGRFGEIYLVDWGIAVSLSPDPTGRLPLASETTEMAGTPAYMAPEMLGTGTLDERTDVYLLGAILYEILTGRSPHDGTVFQKIVASILLSSPTFPDDVPPELAVIARKAMSRLAEDRFASAEQLRLRVEWYLRHRGSIALSLEASRRVDEMKTILREGDDYDAVRERVHHLFAEARFGFRQAIRTCDDNLVARNGLRDATEMVVVYELEAGKPEAAAAALAELETPPKALAERVSAALGVEKKRRAALEKLGREHDLATGRRTRAFAAVILGVAWTVLPQAVAMGERRWPDHPYWFAYAMTTSLVVLVWAIGIWGRESLSKTLVNRRTASIVLLALAAQLAIEVGGRLMGLPNPVVWPLHLFAWFMATASLTILVDARFWPSVVASLSAFFVAAIKPAHVFDAMSFSNFVLLANLVVAWVRPREDRAFLKERVRERRRR